MRDLLNMRRLSLPCFALTAALMLGTFPVSADAEPEPLDAVHMERETRELVREYLDPAMRAGIAWALAHVEQETLGPQPPNQRQRQRLRGPVQDAKRLRLPDDVEGEGTAENPYRGAIARFLEGVDKPLRVILPAGHYEEFDLNVPERVWLVGEAGAVIQSPREPNTDNGRAIVRLAGPHAGLIGIELQATMTATRVAGIFVADGADHALIAHNHLHHLPGRGIQGRGTSKNVLIYANRIERLGYSGMRLRTGWRAESNVIRHTGIFRMGGMGWGGDGIITAARQTDVVMANNLSFQSRRLDPAKVLGIEHEAGDQPMNAARHNLATQKAERITMRGNVLISDGSIRFPIALADSSHDNQVVGNLILELRYADHVTDQPDPRPEMDQSIGAVANGSGNRIEGNAFLGVRFATNTGPPKRPDHVDNIVRYNFGRVTALPYRTFGPEDTVENNDIHIMDYDRIIRHRLQEPK